MFSNYMPVSLLQFKKNLDKNVYFMLDNFIELHEILNESQFGFRKKNQIKFHGFVGVNRVNGKCN